MTDTNMIERKVKRECNVTERVHQYNFLTKFMSGQRLIRFLKFVYDIMWWNRELICEKIVKVCP